jgi:hypothetical protein
VQKIRGLNFRRIPFKGIYLQGGSMDGWQWRSMDDWSQTNANRYKPPIQWTKCDKRESASASEFFAALQDYNRALHGYRNPG